MIIDTFERGSRYSLGSLWNALFPELMKLVEKGDSLPDGRYPLAGGPEKGGVMVSVETYAPREASETRYEGHTLMADIQAVLSGDEYLDMFPLHGGEKEREGHGPETREGATSAAGRESFRNVLFCLSFYGFSILRNRRMVGRKENEHEQSAGQGKQGPPMH